MRFSKSLIAAASLLAASGAFATTASLGQLTGSFLALSSSNVSGGALYSGNALPNAAIPFDLASGTSTVGTWLAAGPSSTNNGGGAATLTLPGGTTALSFLWGSPDSYNALTVSSTGGPANFTSTGVGIGTAGIRNQAFYVTFTAASGQTLSALEFSVSPSRNAFEISNVTAVPEPETYALMLAGLFAVGFIARRRRVV